jgi:CcmD family protein
MRQAVPTPDRAPAVAETPEGRAQEFVPVGGGTETTSGGTLLVIAYLLMWALLLGFVLQTFRKQGALESRLGELERALKKPPPS